MRDPDRIDRIIEALRQAWHRHPDWRLNQLVINASDTPYDCDKPQECGLGLVYYQRDPEITNRQSQMAKEEGGQMVQFMLLLKHMFGIGFGERGSMVGAKQKC